MKRTLISILTTLFLVFSLEASAGQLVAILVGDTEADDIGSGTKINLRNMEKEMREISMQTGLPLQLHIIKGNDYNSGLLGRIRTLDIQPDDTVFFYYTGHGYRQKDKMSPLPDIWISSSYQGISHDTINETIKKKQPRLLISFVNSCNNYVDFFVPEVRMDILPRAMGDFKGENYRRLFVETRGEVVASSSSPGQYSWINLWTGDFFTNAFLSTLHQEARKPQPADWEQILNITSLKTHTDTQKSNLSQQVPQYFFKLVPSK